MTFQHFSTQQQQQQQQHRWSGENQPATLLRDVFVLTTGWNGFLSSAWIPAVSGDDPTNDGFWNQKNWKEMTSLPPCSGWHQNHEHQTAHPTKLSKLCNKRTWRWLIGLSPLPCKVSRIHVHFLHKRLVAKNLSISCLPAQSLSCFSKVLYIYSIGLIYVKLLNKNPSLLQVFPNKQTIFAFISHLLI